MPEQYATVMALALRPGHARSDRASLRAAVGPRRVGTPAAAPPGRGGAAWDRGDVSCRSRMRRSGR